MKSVSLLIKPASSLCNLRCKYCFYANISSMREVRSFGRMKSTLVNQLVSSVFADLEDGDELSIAFQGGEPTLAGLAYFEHFVQAVSQQPISVQVHYAIQTNGMVINERWCQFLKTNEFLVGLSIDGLARNHNLNRVDVRGRGTYYRVHETKRLFDEYHVDYNILCVLTNQLAAQPDEVFDALMNERIQYIQFIPCLDDLDAGTSSSYALTPQRFASFYKQYFKRWYAQLQTGVYQSVKLFDDIINLFHYGRATACGITGQCRVQYVIEADGSVYPCDFYALDEYRLGYIQEQTLSELFHQPQALTFLSSRKTLPSKCATCPFKTMCCGGCKRMKDAMYVDEESDFCGYQAVLSTIVPKQNEIMAQMAHVELVKQETVNI